MTDRCPNCCKSDYDHEGRAYYNSQLESVIDISFKVQYFMHCFNGNKTWRMTTQRMLDILSDESLNELSIAVQMEEFRRHER